MGKQRSIRVWRGDKSGGGFQEYTCEVDEGMVVLDLIFLAQSEHANDLAVRWNCKAGKCGSCSMEINGKPKLGCMTRLSDYPEDEVITVQPMKTFPSIRDLVCDVSWNYQKNKEIKPFKGPEGKTDYVMETIDVERVQEFRKCIECFLCQDTCHVLRDQDAKDKFVGPRYMIRLAQLDMHPHDQEDRIPATKDIHGSGYCNITRCCTEVCPEHIGITDNGIIPMKERVVDRFYDPVTMLARAIFGGK